MNPGEAQTSRLLKLILSSLAFAMAIFHIVSASPFVLWPNLLIRGIHLLFALLIGYLSHRLTNRRFGPWIDGVLIALSLYSMGYLIINYAWIEVRPPWTQQATLLQISIAFSALVVVLELTRRTLGKALCFLCLAFIIYAFVGPYLRFWKIFRPLAHKGVSLHEFVDQMYFSFEGIFGIALGVSTEFIFMFVLFGAVLQMIGGGDFFINVTRALTGMTRGGPAKMAVVASALMGTMSGSSVANVATTGTLTIPMMKKTGYPPVFAGAVEAVASVGGQIMPPIMGAGAFLMAAILGIEYMEVAAGAAIPAVLFFTVLFIAVHWEALRINLAPLAAEDTEPTLKVLAGGWTYMLPLGVLIFFLFIGYTPSLAAFYGVISALIVPYLRPKTVIPLTTLLQALKAGAQGSIVIAVACAAAGIIVGIVSVSGLGFRFSNLVVDLSGDSIWVAMSLSMVAAFIFGMGMPTTAAYVIQATLIAPALVELGAQPLAAHLFVFYYAVLGQITPPVAVAAYAAAPIAKVDASAVGWRAFLIAIPVYVIPYIFVINPELLAQQGFLPLVPTLLRAACTMTWLSIAAVGWMSGGKIPFLYRLVLASAAVLLVVPTLVADALGVGLFVLVWFQQRRINSSSKMAVEPSIKSTVTKMQNGDPQ